MVRPPDPRLIDFLSPYDPAVSALALALRKMVLEEAPDAVESLYDAYNAVAVGFSFTGRLKDGFCHIATYSRHVNLGFNRGAALPDPRKVLAGTGKSVRHIRIAGEADLRRPFLKDYIRAAVAQVDSHPIPAPPKEKSVVRGNYPVKRRPHRSSPPH